MTGKVPDWVRQSHGKVRKFADGGMNDVQPGLAGQGVGAALSKVVAPRPRTAPTGPQATARDRVARNQPMAMMSNGGKVKKHK